MLPVLVRDTVDDLLARLDRWVPARIEGFYVVGSACTGDFRAGRSDVDFVAIVANELGSRELRRMRAVHGGRWASSLLRDVALQFRWPLVCNGIYLRPGNLAKSPLDVTPIAAQVAGRFRVAKRDGFDVNPVTWHMLARHGIAIRGPGRDRLQIRTDGAELRMCTGSNLNSYWRTWAERMQRDRPSAGALPRRSSAWGVLGAPRLHHTLATGAIAGKEAAAQYALEVFEPRWHPLIEDALAFWRDAPSRRPYRHHPGRRQRDAGAFVATVIDAANNLVRHGCTAL